MKIRFTYLSLLLLMACSQEDGVEYADLKEPVYLLELLDKETGKDFFQVYDSIYTTSSCSFLSSSSYWISLWTYDTLNVMILRMMNSSYSHIILECNNEDSYPIDMYLKGSYLDPKKLTFIYNSGEDSTVIDFTKNPTLFKEIQDRNAFVYGEQVSEPPVTFSIYLDKN